MKEPVWPYLLELLEKRVEQGRETYGRLLTTENGRDALLDAWEEAADLLMYLTQCLMERERCTDTRPDEEKPHPTRS